MKINKKELLDALERVKPGLASKELIAQTTSFAFIKGRVVTYNDTISISHPVPGLDLEGAIQAEGLFKFLNKVKKDDLELEIVGNEITLTSGRAKAGFTLQTEIKLPLDNEIMERTEWRVLSEDFIKAIQFVMSACSRDSTVCNSVCVERSGAITATDNYRIARYTLADDMPCMTFLLPSDAAVEVVKLNPVHIAEGNGWVHFETEEGTIISCRTSEGIFPNVSQILTIKGEKLELPKAIDEILDRAMVFAKRDHILEESVKVSISDRAFKVRATSDTGWFEEETNIKYEGTLAFSIAPYLLKDILSKTLVCEVCGNKLMFEGSNWVYITLLMIA
jgi:hypothetical protein